MEDTPNIYNIPIFISDNTISLEYGTTTHKIKARVKDKIGPIIKIDILAWDGNIVSLANNFTPSLNGCNNPYKPTTFGPFLNWIDPNIFLSANVTKATAIKTGTIIINIFIKFSIIINNMI